WASSVDESTREREIGRWSLDAASARELPGLEAFLAEHGAPLRRLERHGGFFTARRTRRDCFHPFARHAGANGTSRALALTALAPLRLVLEVLVGEELLLARRPDELRRAIHAPEDPVLELHRSLPRRGRGLAIPIRAATSSDSVYVRVPASLFVCPLVSGRTSAS